MRTKPYKLLYIKRRLFQTKVNVTGLISNGLVHRVPKQRVIDGIKREIRYISSKIALSRAETNRLYIQSINQYNVVSKQVASKLRQIDKKFGKQEQYDENLIQRQVAVSHSVQKMYIKNSRLLQEENEIAYAAEHRMKHDNIWNLIQDSRSRANTDEYSPFFLASAHPKPAKDHAEWEGKMYIDEDYTRWIHDEKTLARVESYIRNHRLRTVQWVIGEPVYLITRSNCKHFLVNIPLDEVLHASTKSLLKRHKMYMANEEPITPAIRAYRGYYERLKIQLELYKICPSEELKKEIKKTRNLMNKWLTQVNQVHSGQS